MTCGLKIATASVVVLVKWHAIQAERARARGGGVGTRLSLFDFMADVSRPCGSRRRFTSVEANRVSNLNTLVKPEDLPKGWDWERVCFTPS